MNDSCRQWRGRTRLQAVPPGPPHAAPPSCAASRCRDCHFADALSPSLLMHLLRVEGGAAEWQNSRQGLCAPASGRRHRGRPARVSRPASLRRPSPVSMRFNSNGEAMSAGEGMPASSPSVAAGTRVEVRGGCGRLADVTRCDACRGEFHIGETMVAKVAGWRKRPTPRSKPLICWHPLPPSRLTRGQP